LFFCICVSPLLKKEERKKKRKRNKTNKKQHQNTNNIENTNNITGEETIPPLATTKKYSRGHKGEELLKIF